MILYLFAFLSGLLTIAAPCIWPLLPIVLSSSATGGKRKALGITIGVMASFAFFTLTLSYLVKLVPFDPNLLRYFAGFIIIILGLSLLIPKLSQVLESWVSRLSAKFGGRTYQSGGFGAGLLTGVSLGIVWSPCAGPILATVAALSITQSVNAQVVLVTLFYVLGIGIPLFLFTILGSHLFQNTRFISRFTGRLQQIFGVVIIATAILILTGYDKVLQVKLLNAFPALSNFTISLDNSQQVRNSLDQLKKEQLHLAGDSQTLEGSELSNLGKAPEFVGITKWLNTEQPLTMSELKGKVVLIDFWTYTCINCIRTLPFVTSWYDKYSSLGFVVVGVHTPEFEFEKNTGNVLSAIKQYNIHYPVAQDNNFLTWNAYSNQYWPAEYLIDVKGNIRRVHFGEGEYDETEKAIQELLKEAGQDIRVPMTDYPDQTPKSRLSPESYLGSDRMAYLYPNGRVGSGGMDFALGSNIPLNSFSFGGGWVVSSDMAESGKGAVLDYHFLASKVFLVMKPPLSGSGKVKVTMDGKLIKEVVVDSDKLYSLIDLLGSPSDHLLHLEFTPGIQVFAFTFG
jgi:cytochrome c biogenesis protein CcdA/thiol-disulfide isomerase/thioredoxin